MTSRTAPSERDGASTRGSPWGCGVIHDGPACEGPWERCLGVQTSEFPCASGGGVKAPDGLGAGGADLWSRVTGAHVLNAGELAQLTEACRAKDRLDRLDATLRSDDGVWGHVEDVGSRGYTCTLRVADPITRVNDTATLLKQLLAALRLPDKVTGRRPQRRGARGVQLPSVPGGSRLAALDRLRTQGSNPEMPSSNGDRGWAQLTKSQIQRPGGAEK